MKTNSTLKLSESLQEKAKAEAEQIQLLQQKQLERLVENLNRTLTAELTTTQLAIREDVEKLSEITGRSAAGLKAQQQTMLDEMQTMLDEMQSQQDALMESLNRSNKAAVRSLRWSWLRATVPALAVLAVILSASWGLIEYQSQQVMSLVADIRQGRQTLERLPTGVEFTAAEGNQYLILQAEPETYKSESGAWVVKLSK